MARRTPKLVEWNGEKKTLYEWSKQMQLPFARVYNRYRNGWPLDEVFEVIPHRHGLSDKSKAEREQRKHKLDTKRSKSTSYRVVDGKVQEWVMTDRWLSIFQ